MAVTEILSAVKSNIMLNNGTTTTGNIRMLGQTIGTLNYAAWDPAKAYAISQVAAQIFNKPVVQLQGVKTFIIDNEG